MSPRRELSEHCKRLTYEALVALGGEASRQDIRERALAPGNFTAEQLAVPGPEGRPEVPRLVDHYLSLSLTWLKKEGKVDNPARGTWRIAEPSAAAEKRVDPRAEYRIYLASEAWQVRRTQALEEAGGRCQLDATHDGPFDVHHNSYQRLGAELPTDLVVLCRACHGRHHGHELAIRRQLAAKSAAQQERTAWWRPSSWRRAAA